ncbi:MAG: prepilin-type N-terminal cleavage/methylation domain-containing protein [Proteobacteria bacterium]|nr:prepilin-type N-terminal cleavage/methylation domain-containing protein [Pseudomonadota bacterium]
MGRPPRSAGFTLIELLVAALILAVMAGLGWRGLNSVAQGRDAASVRMHAAEQLSLAMRQLGDDLNAASDEGTGLPAVSLGGNGDLLIVRRAPQALGADVRAWPGAQTPLDAGLLQVVRWGLLDGSWMRWASAPTALRGMLLGAMQSPQGQPLAVLTNITDVRILVYRYAGLGLLAQTGAWVNPYTASNATGNSPQAIALRTPAALRLTLQSAAPDLQGMIMREFLLENRQ